MSNIWDWSDITSKMFDTKDQDAEILRKLQIQKLRQEIDAPQKELDKQAGLANYLSNNQGRTRETSVQENVPVILGGPQGEGEGWTAVSGTLQPEMPISVTRKTPAETDDLGLSKEYFKKTGDFKSLSAVAEAQRKQIEEQRKSEQEDEKIRLNWAKGITGAIKDGDNESIKVLIDQGKKGKATKELAREMEEQGVKVTSKGKFEMDVEIKEGQQVFIPGTNTLINPGWYRVELDANGKPTGKGHPIEKKNKDKYNAVGNSGHFENKETGKVEYHPEWIKPDKDHVGGLTDLLKEQRLQDMKDRKQVKAVEMSKPILAKANAGDNISQAEIDEVNTIRSLAGMPKIIKKVVPKVKHWYGDEPETYQYEMEKTGAAQPPIATAPPMKAPVKSGEQGKNKSEMAAMPPASKHKGRRLKDTKTGKRYISDGVRWNEEW